ncbi:ABC transporter permease [Streptacidiphilus cavernicola]|uniref:Transport permease protein n=1 Tax=Streptacidiphilus cavernicola TaxID=3342716 RepID=A0ABV6VZX6_9ACTN
MATLLSAAPPAPRRGRSRALLLVERNLMIYRHTWSVFVAEIFEPVLYLLTIGLGVGQLVGHIPGLGTRNADYTAFVAPALLATAAMNSAMNETTFNLFYKLKFDRVYDSILTTPMNIRDVVTGEVYWAVLRGVTACVGFLAVVSCFGAVRTPWVLLVVPGAAVIAFSFAAVGLAVTTYLRTSHDFQLIQLVMLPMFLFATTFYPLGVYPRPVQIAVECLPLYQAIELLRGPALGEITPGLLLAVGYLLLLGLAGRAVAIRRLSRSLLH